MHSIHHRAKAGGGGQLCGCLAVASAEATATHFFIDTGNDCRSKKCSKADVERSRVAAIYLPAPALLSSSNRRLMRRFVVGTLYALCEERLWQNSPVNRHPAEISYIYDP